MEQKNNNGEETPQFSTEQILIATYAIMIKSMEIATKFSLALLALMDELDSKGIINKAEIEARGMDLGRGVVSNLIVDSKDISYINNVMQQIKEYEDRQSN